MKLNKVFEILEEYAPVSLSNEFCKKYNMYDNSGVIINCGQDITGVIFSLDLSTGAVNAAKSRGYNLIVTHHPAIFGGISRLDIPNDPQAALLSECVKHGISVISMHLNFDIAPRGIDYYLMRGLGGEKEEGFLSTVQGGGYGRVYNVQTKTFSDFCGGVLKTFSTQRALFYGDPLKQVKKVASFCGAGSDGRAIDFARKSAADVFVSSDMKHHEISALLQSGINVVVLTHYSAEQYGFKNIYLKIKEGLKISAEYNCDCDVL